MRKIIPLMVSLVFVALFFIFQSFQAPKPVSMAISVRIPEDYTGKESVSLIIESQMPQGKVIDFEAGQLYQYILEDDQSHQQITGGYPKAYHLNSGEIFQAQITFGHLKAGEYKLTVISQPVSGEEIKYVTDLAVLAVDTDELTMIATSVLGDFQAYLDHYESQMADWIETSDFSQEDLIKTTDAMIQIQQTDENVEFMYLGLEDWTDLSMGQLTSDFTRHYGSLETNDVEAMVQSLEKGFICYPSFYSASYNHQARGWYMAAIQQDDFYWSDTYLDAFTMDRIVSVARQLKSDGALVGVVGMDINLRNLKSLLADYESRYSCIITIANATGGVFYRTENQAAVTLEDLGLDHIEAAGIGYYGPSDQVKTVFHLKEATYTRQDIPKWSIFVEYKD